MSTDLLTTRFYYYIYERYDKMILMTHIFRTSGYIAYNKRCLGSQFKMVKYTDASCTNVAKQLDCQIKTLQCLIIGPIVSKLLIPTRLTYFDLQF